MNRNQLLNCILLLQAAAVVVALGSLISRSGLWEGKKAKTQRGSVAVLHISGPIRFSMNPSAFGSDDAEDVVRRLHRLSENEDVKAIVLQINSPGGTVGAVQEIYAEVLRCKAKGKKVVAALGDVAASGGYYIAASADKVVSNPGTITGSIGVIMQFGNLEGLFQKLGVRLQVVKSGLHKDIGSPARALTPEERQLLQASIDDAYAQFVEAVVKGRSLDSKKVLELADGRIFTGRQAHQAGLVDKLGGSQDALETAIELANLPPHPRILTDSSKSFLSMMKHFSSLTQAGALETWGLKAPGVTLEYALR